MAKKLIKHDVRQEIIAQSLKELEFAREYKQGKVGNWKLNESLYYGQKMPAEDSRANVDLGKMGSFVHTILSKIDAPLIFKFMKRKLAQLKRVQQLNALVDIDADRDDWNIKDLVGKKQALIYGRAIYSYTAESTDGYTPRLENVDVYDYLIDPSAGGLDIERAGYMGRYGVIKTRDQIKDGIKSGKYLKTEGGVMLQGGGNADADNQEETNKTNRIGAQDVWKTQKNLSDPDKYKFWEWYTTYKGVRYYVLLSEDRGSALRVIPLKDLFASDLFPFWTWAAYLDLTEFWTPSYCDYVRELFMAQAVSINQMLDNSEEINKPMKGVNVSAIENLQELKYRKGGYIKFKRDFDINSSIQFFRPPVINTPITVFQVLEGISEKSSGVTAGAQGDATNNSGAKATIFEGNQANAADRFGLLNKSYAFGYKRFARLYEAGVKEHLTKKMAIDIIGPDGVPAVTKVSKRDLFKAGDSYGVKIESSNAELALSAREKELKLQFLRENALIPVPQGAKPIQNNRKAYEIMAETVGFDAETIKQLQDVDNFGTASVMAEADRDIEALLEGEKISPNQIADTAYKQRFVDYMQDNQEQMSEEEFRALADYTLLIDPIVNRNMVRKANEELFRQRLLQATSTPVKQPRVEDVELQDETVDPVNPTLPRA